MKKYLDQNEIFEDIVSKLTDLETKHLLASNFTPNPYGSKTEKLSIIMQRSSFGRWLRNSYDLWNVDNPHTQINVPPNSDGIIDNPLFPDNYSEVIIQKLVSYYQTMYPNVKYFSTRPISNGYTK